jgi:DNA-binding NarL/FixJ family response regulator
MKNIAILEDLVEVSEMLKTYINKHPNFQCHHVYSNAEDAMNFVVHNNIDILIVDIGLPRASGIDAIIHLKPLCPKLQFCMFTIYEDDDKIFKSILAGAKGYMLKSASKEKMIEALTDLAAGGSPMSPSIARRVLDQFSTSLPSSSSTELPISCREMELLTLLSKGLLYKEIASTLGITIGTVKQHIHHIYDKLQVSNKTEAINMLNNT